MKNLLKANAPKAGTTSSLKKQRMGSTGKFMRRATTTREMEKVLRARIASYQEDGDLDFTDISRASFTCPEAREGMAQRGIRWSRTDGRDDHQRKREAHQGHWVERTEWSDEEKLMYGVRDGEPYIVRDIVLMERDERWSHKEKALRDYRQLRMIDSVVADSEDRGGFGKLEFVEDEAENSMNDSITIPISN
jgi:hypothetical protein